MNRSDSGRSGSRPAAARSTASATRSSQAGRRVDSSQVSAGHRSSHDSTAVVARPWTRCQLDRTSGSDASGNW